MAEGVHIIMDMRHLFGKKGKDPTGEKTKVKDKDKGTEETSETTPKEKQKKPAGASGRKKALKDWEKELKRRIDEFNALDPETQANTPGGEGEIEVKFWEDFFTTNWKAEVADKLLQIDLLQDDIKELGFNPLLNPILAFLKRPFAQKLLLNDLLNSDTYTAIHNAVSYNYIADSEFVKENVYNILYCIDLYKQPSADMERYLKLQKSILSPSAPAYNEKTMAKNIKVFLVNGYKTVADKGAKLNELEDVEAFMKQFGISTGGSKNKGASDDSETTGQEGSNEDDDRKDAERKDLVHIVQELKNHMQIMAAMQYICLSTNSDIARKNMHLFNKGNFDGEKLTDATFYVAKLMKGLRLKKDEVETFIDLLTDKQKELPNGT